MHWDRKRLCGFSSYAAILAAIGWTLTISQAPAQPVAAPAQAVMVEGQPATPEQQQQIMEAQKRGRPGGPQPGQPGQPPNGDPSQDKKEGDNKDKKKEEDSTKRPEKPPRVPDPREMEVAMDDKGRVPAFNFIGQPWPDVMQWLANISKCSLDWQELPNDYLNLTTQRAYPLDEVRDLINRHLHARGYTSIQVGEVLSVFKIDKLDPSLVRRVSEDELYDLKPYDFVKVSFELPQGMEVDKAKDDVKQVLSPNAKVFPLVSTKRLLLIDAVANLRLVSGLLNEERAEQSGRIVPKEFVLKYARAEQVIQTLFTVLGMDQKSRSSPQMDAQMQQQQMQMMQQMQQQGKDVSKMMAKKDAPAVYLALNRQRNSVLANAPPEQMRVIEQTIAYVDVPLNGAGEGAVVAGNGDSLPMKRYQLVTLDPERLVTTLEEVGDLSPLVELRADSRSKSLFVSRASAADHERIRVLIDDLDGTGRQFEVIPLRKLPADLVATTIVNLMVGKEEKKDDESNRYSYFFGGRSREDDEADKPNKGFRVDADIENNRLMLWASDAELAEVRRLLEKMGEIPGRSTDPRPVRFVQQEDAEATAKLIEKLRAAWSATGNNELIIQAPEKPPAALPKENEAEKKDAAKPAADRSAESPPRAIAPARLVQLEVAVKDESAGEVKTQAVAKPEQAAAPEPITITVTENGQLMLSSKDTAALDRLEELIENLTPADKRFKVFRLQYITALNMKWNLEDLFKEELKTDSAGYIRDYWSGDLKPRAGTDKGLGGLSKRRKLMITWDTPSNSILVANASPSQLTEIEQLIAEYDRPAPADSVKTRKTVTVKIRYSKAKVIAEALKEVYRDLLSSRDKEFDKGDQKDRGATTERVTMIRYGSSDSSDNSSSQRPSPVKVGFEGALSVGVDEIANVIIISVQEELYEGVVAMVHKLDQEAAPDTTVQVRRVSGSVSAEAIQKALSQAVGKPWVGGRPEAEPKANDENAGKEGDKNQNGDGKRGERNRGNRGNND